MGVHVLEANKETDERYQSSSLRSSLSSSRMTSGHMKPWKSRSKSQTRLALASGCCWMSEGQGRWRNSEGQLVDLQNFPLLNVTEVERLALQRLALSRLQDLNLGCPLELPKSESGVAQEATKRRPILLRKKAATTNFFDGKEKDKGSNPHRAVFGISLYQCIAHDKMRARSLGEDTSAQRQKGQNHCEEVLSALRISYRNLSEESSLSSREGSQTDIRVDTTSMTQKTTYTRRSISDIFAGEAQVPHIVQLCIRFLEYKGLKTLGIFRVSGSQKRIRQLREDLEVNQNFTFDDSIHPHDIAQLLKEFFRDLPEPLLNRSLYRAFIATQRINDFQRRLKATRWLLYLLPVAHRDTLATLLAFLEKVTNFSDDYKSDTGVWATGNKMDSSNLATVFGPNLLRMSKGSTETQYAVHTLERAQERCDVILTIRGLMENHKSLFQVTTEDLDAIFHKLMVDDPQVLNVLLYRHMYTAGLEEISTESSSGISQTEKINLLLPMSITAKPKDNFGSQTSVEKTEKSESVTELNVKSRIRPLVFSKEDKRAQEMLEYSCKTRKAAESAPNEQRLCQVSTRFETTHDPFAVSASFTVKMENRVSSRVSGVPPLSIYETDQGASLKPRRVPYGALRHLTTPAYVSQEMPITITIPWRKHISNVKETPTKYEKYDSLAYGGLIARGGNILGTKETVTQKSRQSTESEKQGLFNVRIAGQVSRTSPSVQERWKRQEIIASEHIQL